MSEPALMCKSNAIFTQNSTQKLFIDFQMTHACSFNLRGNLENIFKINYRKNTCHQSRLLLDKHST